MGAGNRIKILASRSSNHVVFQALGAEKQLVFDHLTRRRVDLWDHIVKMACIGETESARGGSNTLR